MLLGTPALATRVERAEIAFCALTAGYESPGGVLMLDRAGGRAVFGRLGSPLNKVLGLGIGVEVTDADLDDIERFYVTHGSSVSIEVCPLAGGSLASRLAARGYVIQAFENELGRAVPAALPAPGAPDVVVATDAADGTWLDTVARGFATPDTTAERADAAEQADAVAAMSGMMQAFLHPAIVRYLATIGGVPAGAGAAYCVDGVVGIFGTATVPRFRRRGVQAAIVCRAFADHASRADLAIATTEPGSTSQRTFERLGFQVLYTRSIMVRDARVSAPPDRTLPRTARDGESRGA
jgi:hypothetical protein